MIKHFGGKMKAIKVMATVDEQGQLQQFAVL
jgi:hypothetical protein